ncbi:hypothetical protein N9L68_06685 [bacterium]|nr:hypothetical protein [bacterium]
MTCAFQVCCERRCAGNHIGHCWHSISGRQQPWTPAGAQELDFLRSTSTSECPPYQVCSLPRQFVVEHWPRRPACVDV